MVQFARDYLHLYIIGALVAIILTLATMAGSIGIGFLAALGRLSERRPIRTVASSYVAIFRGVPPLVLLYVVYFGLPSWAHDVGISFLVNLLSPLNNRILAGLLPGLRKAGLPER